MITEDFMTIKIASNILLEEVQKDFSEFFPYLRLRFLPNTKLPVGQQPVRQNMVNRPGMKFGDLNNKIAEGSVELNDSITVRALENIFKTKFGVTVQVLRKSGNIWMEASITGNWTLGQQNEHGREISGNND